MERVFEDATVLAATRRAAGKETGKGREETAEVLLGPDMTAAAEEETVPPVSEEVERDGLEGDDGMKDEEDEV